MRLEAISIRRYRSIEDCDITNIGDFNVLIGKNNSGKSNILMALNAFFASIQKGNIVTIESSIGKEIDFFARKTSSPIEVTLTVTAQVRWGLAKRCQTR
jgi:predicted ATPase